MTLLARRGWLGGVVTLKGVEQKICSTIKRVSHGLRHTRGLRSPAGSKQICLRYVQDGGNKCTIRQTGSAFAAIRTEKGGNLVESIRSLDRNPVNRAHSGVSYPRSRLSSYFGLSTGCQRFHL